MRWFKADLHIHSVLSPCGDLDMSPTKIISKAKDQQLDIIGITDHNSTLHAELMMDLGYKNSIAVFPGAEVTTQEEVHCLVFFENIETIKIFQDYLDLYKMKIPNKPEKFGYQLVVNEKEEILKEVNELLILGINQTIEQIEQKTHELNGIFIPAHIDKSVNSIYSQIGFIPNNLKIDAIEISANTTEQTIQYKKPELLNHSLISNSDAHYIKQIGKRYTEYYMKAPVFSEWKMALQCINERKARIK